MKKILSTLIFLCSCSITFSQIILTSTVSHVSCFGGSNGSATVTATGGTGAYTYTWMPSNTNSNIITGLAAGNYTIYVEDAVATTNSLVVTITEPPALTPTLTTTNPTCNGFCDGTAGIAFSGGTGTTTFLWQPGLQSGNSVNNLCAGSQTVTITSNGVCSTSLTFTLTEPAQLTAVTTVTHTNCGQANGKTCAAINGGTGATTYSWSNGVTTLCNSGLAAGGYTLSVTDANGCTTNAYSLIGDYAGPVVSISSQTNVSCFGGCNGIATPSVSGTPPYIYNWSNGQVSASATNLCAGLYTLSVTDNAGCIGTTTVVITQPTQLNAVVSSTSTSCFGYCNGSANISASGGAGAYTYVWNNQNTAPLAAFLCPGIWQCIITDANACTLTQTVAITQPPPITINVNTSNASCNSTCNGTATVSVTGGTPIYSFTSQPFGLTSGINSNLCAGSYTLEVLDANACFSSTIFYISQFGGTSLPNATVTSLNYNETCFQSGDGAIDLNISGTNPGPFTYLWSNGATTQDITNITSDIYWVNVMDGNSNCLTLTDTINPFGVNCGTITGNIFIDNNSDCIKNTGDNNYNSAGVIINPGNRLGYTNNNGDYSVNNLPYGTYSVSINNLLPNVYPSCTTTLTSFVNAGSPTSLNNNLSVAFNSVIQPDMQVSAWNGGIVPGFVCRMNYNLKNLNNVNGTGFYKATLPSAFISNITNASPIIYTLSGDSIIWNFSNATFTGGLITFYVDFTVPLSTPLGSIFTSCMWAQPNMTDLNYGNNTYCYSRMVTGSFDPNDKTVSPVGIGPNGDIAVSETDLTYLIRFQNTGNGPAVNIVVKDTLSPNVDINTFEMLSSSHNYNIDVMNGNILRWKFNNIMLPDSNSNEPGSHGYIHYRIKRNSNNSPGTQIKNTAYIYFDFNEPVVTNTAINTIETITGIHSQTILNDQWLIYPNPSTGILNLINNNIAADKKFKIEILNSFGQLVFEENAITNHKTVDLNKFSNGVYFVKLISDKQSSIKKIVLSK